MACDFMLQSVETNGPMVVIAASCAAAIKTIPLPVTIPTVPAYVNQALKVSNARVI